MSRFPGCSVVRRKRRIRGRERARPARSIDEASGQVRQKSSGDEEEDTLSVAVLCGGLAVRSSRGYRETDRSRVEELTGVSYIVVVCLRDLVLHFIFISVCREDTNISNADVRARLCPLCLCYHQSVPLHERGLFHIFCRFFGCFRESPLLSKRS